ncbi:MAG: HupE/UreJ family protein [Pseudomonadota bacterium]
MNFPSLQLVLGPHLVIANRCLRIFALLVCVTLICNHAMAHPEDDFCEAVSSLDPALCQLLADTNSSDAAVTKPLLDEAGNVRSPIDTALLYFDIGVRHILPGGTDHILFVLALFLASERLRSLIVQISAFTVAHTVTLGLAAAGTINPPGAIVEPLIALSIAFVAIENLYFKDISKWRPFVIFGFGLFHGMGFAGFIKEVGLPADQFWSSLIGFNIGVEVGQLAVVAAALILSIPIKRALNTSERSFRSVIVQPASLIIAAVGLWWALTRSLGL